jgi:hypothetical protein
MSWLASRLQALRGDSGSVSVIAYAIGFVAIMILLALVLQTAMLSAAREVALTAAQQGADAARAVGGTSGEGQAAACGYVAATRGVLRSGSCTASGGITVTVTVCGNALDLVPGFPVHTCRQVQGPRERFTTRTSP